MTESTLLPIHAATFLSLLLDVSLKSLPVFALAGLVCLGLRRASAAARHALWVVTVVSLLCLPAFCILLPRWLVPVLPASAQHHAQTSKLIGSRVEEVASQQPLVMKQPPTAGVGKLSPQASPATGSAASIPCPAPSLSAPGVSPSPTAPVVANPRPITSTTRHPAFIPTMTQLILATWLVGVLMVLARAFIGIVAARRLVRRCQKAISGPLADAAEQARATLGLSFGVAVREGQPGTEVLVPMTFGLLRPVVLLPHGAAKWPAERLRVVMLHEVAHVKRRDWLTTMLVEVACALYWFHPLVWLAAHRLRAESEQACDDLVLTSGVQAVDYADHLLEVVRGLTGRHGFMPAVVTMAQERDLTGRLKTILAQSNNRSAATSRGLALAVLTALVIVMPLAAMHPVAFAQAKVQGKEKEAGQQEEQKILSSTTFGNLTVGKPQWDKKLADGTRVRLLFVGAEDAQYHIVSAWTPDGVQQPPGDRSTRLPLIRGEHGYQFFYEITFSSAKRQNTATVSYLQAGRSAGNCGGVQPWRSGAAISEREPVSFPESQTKGTVSVNVASGPETTLITGTPRAETIRRLSTGELVTVGQPFVTTFPSQYYHGQATEVSVTLPSRFVHDESEYQFYAVDRNGKRINVQHAGNSIPDTSAKTAHILYTFRTFEMPLDRVKEFRFTYRPCHTAVFRDVALRPDGPAVRQPAARASTPLAASPMASTGARAVVNAVGGLAQVEKGVSLQLVAASDNPWDNRQWWRPDGTPFVYNAQVFRTNYTPPPRTYPQVQSALVFRLTQAEDDTTVEGWQSVPGVNLTTTCFSCVNITKGSVRSILSGNLRKIPEGPTTSGVRLRVGTGPWRQEQVRFSPTEGAGTIKHSGDGWNGVYEVRRLSATSTKIAVTPAAQNQAEAMRVVAFDRQGHQYLPGPSFSGMLLRGNPPGPRTEYPLLLPLSQIKKLVVEVRPYRYVDFNGIARHPVTSVRSVASPSLPAKAQADQDVSEANLHQIGLGIFQYAAAHDQHFPDAAHWMDQIIPYLIPSQTTGAARRQRIVSLFHDPAAPAGQTWSYAYNRTLSGLTNSKIDNPNQIVAVFESSHGVKNASDGGQSVPQPGRHSGGTNFLFADGLSR